MYKCSIRAGGRIQQVFSATPQWQEARSRKRAAVLRWSDVAISSATVASHHAAGSGTGMFADEPLPFDSPKLFFQRV